MRNTQYKCTVKKLLLLQGPGDKQEQQQEKASNCRGPSVGPLLNLEQKWAREKQSVNLCVCAWVLNGINVHSDTVWLCQCVTQNCDLKFIHFVCSFFSLVFRTLDFFFFFHVSNTWNCEVAVTGESHCNQNYVRANVVKFFNEDMPSFLIKTQKVLK